MVEPSRTDRHERSGMQSLRVVVAVSAAPALLGAVAAVHVTRVAWCDQSPWRGGGFGMFATPDSPDMRFVRVYLLTTDGELPADAPRLWEASVAQTAPTADNLERLAAQLATLAWTRRPDGACAMCALPDAGAVTFTAIRVELWRAVFDANSNRLCAVKHRETTRPRP
jgi:hypothetical protein